jgi:hypothetical protein
LDLRVGPADLEGSGALLVFELQPHLAAAQAGERLRALGGRAPGDAYEAGGGGADVVDGDHEMAAKGTLSRPWPTNRSMP